MIVGENGSGKTALLEGIFLAAGPSPEIALRTRSWRGYEQERFQGTDEQVEEALWADLFHKFDMKASAEIALQGDTDHNRSVEITFSEGTATDFKLNRRARRAGLLVKDVPPQVEFTWTVPNHEPFSINPVLEDGRLKVGKVPRSHVKAHFFAANRTFSGLETANRFSMLSRTKKSDAFVEMFCRHFPNILDLSVEVSAGAAMLFAEVKDVPEKIPLSLASGGMNKLAAMLLAMPAQPRSIVLIDEIENGVHYARLPKIWESLFEQAKETDSQVFVSTHSNECLNAIAEVARANAQDISIIHSQLRKGASELEQYDGETFLAAMEENIEIR